VEMRLVLQAKEQERLPLHQERLWTEPPRQEPPPTEPDPWTEPPPQEPRPTPAEEIAQLIGLDLPLSSSLSSAS
jgi:hypothetical protein